jgi:hypothetical protein
LSLRLAAEGPALSAHAARAQPRRALGGPPTALTVNPPAKVEVKARDIG